jgi:hypothetical protein
MNRFRVAMPECWARLPLVPQDSLSAEVPLCQKEQKRKMPPEHINPIQWHQASAIARQSCARFFRDGGSPADAMRAFGIDPPAEGAGKWDKAVEAIAEVLCAAPLRRAA